MGITDPEHPEMPRCPDHLQDEARKEWQRVTRELASTGRLEHTDRAALAAYCVLWQTFIECDKKVLESGPVVESKSGNAVVNPYLTARNAAAKLMRQYAADLGLHSTKQSPKQCRDTFPADIDLLG